MSKLSGRNNIHLDNNRLIIALDFDQEKNALALADQLDPSKCRLKVGKEMFTRFGPSFVSSLQARNFEIFLDLKFHDIPNTVAKACSAAADLGVWMTNVHASGGQKMMQAGADALIAYGDDAPLLIAVTVLTSMSEKEQQETGINLSIEERVLKLAKLTQSSGLDGIVCSAVEASVLTLQLADQALEKDFCLVTPGIRPAGSDAGDQHRIMTPTDALSNGADYLVIGRPITQASDPLKVMCDISDSIETWLANND